MSSQSQTNLSPTEYSLKNISWHLKVISERMERTNILLEQMIKQVSPQPQNSQTKQGQGQQKYVQEECPF